MLTNWKKFPGNFTYKYDTKVGISGCYVNDCSAF